MKPYLKGLYEAACKGFDGVVPQTHPNQIRVVMGNRTNHFFDRIIERVNPKNGTSREEILVASVRYVEKFYMNFSTTLKDCKVRAKYRNYEIVYAVEILANKSGVYAIEVTPVTVVVNKTLKGKSHGANPVH